MNTENNYTVPMVKAIYDRCQFSQRSAWSRGVREYAEELLDRLEEYITVDHATVSSVPELEELLLNGAEDWTRYSFGGCALIYNGDIATRLSSPSELKRTDYGNKRPNMYESWVQCQGRALYQAAGIIKKAYKEVLENEV